MLGQAGWVRRPDYLPVHNPAQYQCWASDNNEDTHPDSPLSTPSSGQLIAGVKFPGASLSQVDGPGGIYSLGFGLII